MTVVQRKLKSMPIICIYVMYVTISIMYDCCFFNIFKTLSNIAALFYEEKIYYPPYFITTALMSGVYVAYEYLVYEDFCGGLEQFN